MSPRPAPAAPLAAVVLAGGRGSRLGGVRKGDLRRDGTTLLARALAACAACDEVVVVGDPPAGDAVRDPQGREVRFVREQPAYGGPVAALLTGVAALRAVGTAEPHDGDARVVVLGVDMPLVDAATVARLRAGVDADPEADGAVLVDSSGRTHLALVLRRVALERVAPPPEEWDGMALRRLLGHLRLVPVPARGGEEADVDTWEDARRLGVEPGGAPGR